MHRITSAQFKKAVGLDPAWASKLTETVEITDYCWLDSFVITHLSPLLHFTGEDVNGWSASFCYCKSLKVAEGKFEGFVRFTFSSIEKIGDLSCGKNNDGIRLNVKNCPNLKSIPFTYNPKEVNADSELLKDLTETRAFIQKKRAEIVEIVI